MSSISTFTKRGNKHPWLLYENKETGEAEVIAMLRVPRDEFWDKMGKGLNIKFVSVGGQTDDRTL